MRRKNMEEKGHRILSASFDRPPGQGVAEKLAQFREETSRIILSARGRSAADKRKLGSY